MQRRAFLKATAASSVLFSVNNLLRVNAESLSLRPKVSHSGIVLQTINDQRSTVDSLL